MERLVGILLQIVMVVVLTGCVTANTSDPRAVAEATRVKYDPYMQQTSVIGDGIDLEGFFPNSSTYRLGAGIKNGQSYFHLHIRLWSQLGWYFLSSAADIDGVSLPVFELDREVESGGNVEEKVAVQLSREYLDRHAQSGLNIRVDGKRGSVTYKVPAAYVAGFLAKYDAVTANASSGAQKQQEPVPRANKPVLGVGTIDISPQLAPVMGLKPGARVLRVDPGSCAEKAGIVLRDIIVKFGNSDINTTRDLQAAVGSVQPGSKISVSLWRIDKEVQVSVQF